MVSSLLPCPDALRPCPPGRPRRPWRRPPRGPQAAALRAAVRRRPVARPASLWRPVPGRRRCPRPSGSPAPAGPRTSACRRPTDSAAAPDRDEWVSHCPRGQLGELAGVAQQHHGVKAAGRRSEQIEHEAPGVADLDDLLVGEARNAAATPPGRCCRAPAPARGRRRRPPRRRRISGRRAGPGCNKAARSRVVPRIDRPPAIPSRGLNVRRATSRPPGMAISTCTPRGVTSRTAAAIIRRGAGLMAGCPAGPATPAWSPCPRPRRPRSVTPPAGSRRRWRRSPGRRWRRGRRRRPCGPRPAAGCAVAAARARSDRPRGPFGRRASVTSTAAGGAARPAPWPPPWPPPLHRCRW